MRKTGIKKAVTAFSLCMGVLAFLCFGIPGEAAKTAAHDLKITGGEYGQDYRYDNNSLFILSDTPLTISGTTRKEGIRVKEGTDAKLTLKNVDMRVASGCALDAGSGSTSIRLSGENYLKSGAKYAGILVQEGARVTISGGKSDSLTVFGGSQAAGIGSEKEMSFGDILLEGGTITAVGGARAAGIGGGFQGGGGKITVTGGRIEAGGGAGAADIGSPQEGYGKGSITLNGNCILKADDILDTLTTKKGILLSGGRGAVYQEVALSYPLEISRNMRLTIPAGSSLQIPEKVRCTNKGEMYVYGGLDVLGELDNQGQIYDYTDGSGPEGSITGNEVVVRDLHEIDLLNGSVSFTGNGYEQNGMEFDAGEAGSSVYHIYGDAADRPAQITAEDGVHVTLVLEEVTLSPGENGHCLSVSEDAEVVLVLQGENVFSAGEGALSGCIYSEKNSSVEIRGKGSLTLQDDSGRKLVLSGSITEGTGDTEDTENTEMTGESGEEADSGPENVKVSATGDASVMTALIEREELEHIEEERQSLEISGTMLRIRLDWRAVREVLEDTAGDITFRIRPFEPGEQFTNARFYTAGRPVYDIQVIDMANGGEQVVNVNFAEGTADVSIPYRKPAGEDSRKLYVVYVGADNTLDWLADSYYDAEHQKMVSRVKHFSVYGIGYRLDGTGKAAGLPAISSNTVK